MDTGVLIQCLAALFASAFFGVLLQQPRDTLLHTSLIGLDGFVLYLLLGRGTLGYFAAALFVGLLCEITARVRGRVTMIFLISAAIPLVPGLDLYRTLILLSEHQYQQALAKGLDTLIAFGAIALALTISTTIFANLRPVRSHGTKGTHHAHPDL